MIIVRVQLYPGGFKTGKRTIGKLVIWNDGTGTEAVSHYRWELHHAGVFYGKRTNPWKKGVVRNFPRKLSPYRLVSRCLKAAGEL